MGDRLKRLTRSQVRDVGHRTTKKSFAARGAIVVLVVTTMLVSTAAAAFAASAANIDQCANGGVGDTPVACSGNNWVNGNVNGSKAHWKEGEFLPYRAIVTGLNAGAHYLD